MEVKQERENDLSADSVSRSIEQPETREEVLARHRHEIAQLQNKEITLKKAAAKGSKAEQKAKKKQIDEEISRFSSDLQAKHKNELASLGYNTFNAADRNNLENLVRAVAGATVSNNGSERKTSKSLRRREKRAQQEAEREQKIQKEQGSITSDRSIENEKLERKLRPLGLTVNEIKADGHCLYRAVEDQLSLISGGSSPHTYQKLREMVASYMRDHASEFIPFFLSDHDSGIGDATVMTRFAEYCNEVETTASWGGQLELGALTHCLKQHIMIFSGSFPDVEMGKEYKSNEGVSSANRSIMLSYHKHAFGLGEHYNSVVPNLVE